MSEPERPAEAVGGRRSVVGRARDLLDGSRYRHEVLVILLVAAAVQCVFPYRQDWPAHLAAGAGGIVLLASIGRRRLGRHVRRHLVVIAFGLLLVVGAVTERTIFGPPDAVDVSFTLAGALVGSDLAEDVVDAGDGDRAGAALWGAVLVLGSLAYRYLLIAARW
jgi:hypothetical protein